MKLSSYIRGLSLYPAVFAALPGFNFSFPFVAEARENFLQDPYLPIFLLCICFFLLLRLQTGRPFFNMNRPASALKQKNSTTFADAAGLHAEKRELQEVVNFLKDPARYEAMGARMPKGVLLTGHPGTGKTLLARAVAGEAGVPFYSVSGSEFIEMFVGIGAARVRNLFKQAQKKPPAVIFIDELDALGSRRGNENSLHEETAQTLNQLLVELDGFDQRKGVVVLAATNRPDVLDPALLRPGRFDRRLAIGLPGRGEREEILKLCTKSKPFIRSLNYKTLALLTPGFSGADLENLVNEAALLAVRCRKKRIGMPELEEALDRAIAGVRNSSSSLDQETASVHEAGHALVACMLLGAEVLYKVSIVPRRRTGGQTIFLNRENSYITAEELMGQIATLLGGRAAEEEVFGAASTGCQHDLEQATMLAREMVYQQGMSTELGPAVLQCEHGCALGPGRLSEKTLELAEKEVRSLLGDCYREAVKVVSECGIQLGNLAAALRVKKSLSAKEVKEIIER